GMSMKDRMGVYEYAANVLRIKEKTVLEYLKTKSTVELVKKKTKIFYEGKKPEYAALLVEGVFRSYFINEEDCEVTDCLVNQPGNSLMPGFDLEAPAPATVESLTDGQVFKIRFSDLQELLKSSQEIRTLYQDRMQRAGQYHLEKARVISGCTAEMKYRWFLKTHPGMVNQIPDKHIAAFLRMSPVTLSQIKKKMREQEAAE
ncbi:MAG TPA: Crp/Fnr family transcriptional regulator, partial [Candidatus Lachnoclostridium stercorigallinarum]|nr:Crp/Fnr family transcriptional regulator [Candidatus Lachnoclostridium stercorigallinarum]